MENKHFFGDVVTPIPASLHGDIIPGVKVVSFPKSGRTWLRVMLDELETRLNYTHAESGHLKKLHYSQFEQVGNEFKNQKIIFLVRDPRDVTVSGYFHTTKRLKQYEGDISKFVRDEHHGIQKVLSFNDLCINHLKMADEHLVIRYEDLRNQTMKSLDRIMKFVGRECPTPERVGSVIDRYEFKNMQRLEKEGFFKPAYGVLLGSKNAIDEDSLKTRRGKIGGFIDYLSGADIDYCNQMMATVKYTNDLQYQN